MAGPQPRLQPGGLVRAWRDIPHLYLAAVVPSYIRLVARCTLIPVVVGLCAATFVFPQSAAADPTLTPLPGAPTGAVLVNYPYALGETECSISLRSAVCGLNLSYPVPDWGDSCDPSFLWRATHVRVSLDGELGYSCGGNGFGLNSDPSWFQELDLGTTYQANGWTITPIGDGITFANDATGHGMTFTLGGANAF